MCGHKASHRGANPETEKTESKKQNGIEEKNEASISI